MSQPIPDYILSNNLDLSPLLEHLFLPLGLTISYEPADDESVDDAITVFLNGEDIGDIQIAGENAFIANIWSDAQHDTRYHGTHRNRITNAACDLYALLVEHNRIPQAPNDKIETQIWRRFPEVAQMLRPTGFEVSFGTLDFDILNGDPTATRDAAIIIKNNDLHIGDIRFLTDSSGIGQNGQFTVHAYVDSTQLHRVGCMQPYTNIKAATFELIGMLNGYGWTKKQTSALSSNPKELAEEFPEPLNQNNPQAFRVVLECDGPINAEHVQNELTKAIAHWRMENGLTHEDDEGSVLSARVEII